MNIVLELFIALLVAYCGHCSRLPTHIDEVDQQQIKKALIEDIQELIDNINTTVAPTTVPPTQAAKQELLDLLTSEKALFDEPENDDFSSYLVKKKKPKLGPNQIISKCYFYRHGCCQDGRTPAEGPHYEGCGIKICSDEQPGFCQKYFSQGRIDCRYFHRSKCAYTCQNCKFRAPAKLVRCLSSMSPWGCCWNGEPALGPNQRGCSPCADMYRHVCGQFANVSNGCKSGSYGIRTFMNKYCPKTCGQCRNIYYAKK